MRPTGTCNAPMRAPWAAFIASGQIMHLAAAGA